MKCFVCDSPSYTIPELILTKEFNAHFPELAKIDDSEVPVHTHCLNYFRDAVKSDPNGKLCATCGKENTFVDDCGFFFQDDNDGKGYAARCRNCFTHSTAER